MKQEHKHLKITISLKVEEPNFKQQFITSSATIDTAEMSDLEVVDVDAPYLDMFDKMKLHYTIKENKIDKIFINCKLKKNTEYDII